MSDQKTFVSETCSLLLDNNSSHEASFWTKQEFLFIFFSSFFHVLHDTKQVITRKCVAKFAYKRSCNSIKYFLVRCNDILINLWPTRRTLLAKRYLLSFSWEQIYTQRIFWTRQKKLINHKRQIYMLHFQCW